MSQATINKTTGVGPTEKLELFSDAGFKEKQGISQTEYAKRRGVSRQIISKQVLSGIITLLPNGNIDPESADEELADKLDPAHTQGNKGTESCAPTNGKTDNTFHVAKTKEKRFQAGLVELNYLERNGELVLKKDMEDEAFETGRRFRDEMLRLPQRVISEILAMFRINVSVENIKKAQGVMTTEIRETIQGF